MQGTKPEKNSPAALAAWDGAGDVGSVLERLTAQEQACLRLVAQRMSSKEIAAELGIAKTSVDTYCNRARQKLGVSDRYAAARLLTAELASEPPGPLRPEPVAREVEVASPAPPTRRVIGLALAGMAAAAVGVASLLAGMAALDELRPPNRRRRVPSTSTTTNVADARGG